MGVWGYGSFENDDAADWLAELEGSSNNVVLVDALNAFIDEADDDPDTSTCSIALAAAEVIAALNGEPIDDLPDEIDEWIQDRPAPNETLLANARQVVELILENSELRDSWKESDDSEAWESCLTDLHSRLA